ncbi:MAG: hypothetical protein HRO68_08155 [Nitrosopumilus sp.]|nr:hypothetical protein [Nitrosopumilus sp.]
MGHETVINYDLLNYLPIEIVSPNGTRVNYEYDYRFQKPTKITDENENITIYQYQEFGYISGIFKRGKEKESVGDVNSPSITYSYNLQKIPIYVEETKYSEHDPKSTSKFSKKRDFTDGFGRVIQLD